MFPYFPHTEDDVRAMLEKIGVDSLDALYSDVPASFLYKEEYDLPEAFSEQQVRDFFSSLAAKNVPRKVFVGQGAYDHYTPAVISAITSRSEFLTAYTPYQAEISQGTLRYIFEFQTMICELTGMDTANASMYDGATAAAEAVRMCITMARRRDTVLVSDTLLPSVRAVLDTYAKYAGTRLVTIPSSSGQTDVEAAVRLLEDPSVAGVLVPGVNRFGIVEDLSGLSDAVHSAGARLVVYCDPSTLAVVKTPAEWGADIAVGDAQPLGVPLSYGGPYVGFMACSTECMRKMPGRIVGQTCDTEGRRCYVLTLQAREQHIRREKATSNICSNQSLMALWVTVYLALMGPEGLREVNVLSSDAAHYLHDRLIATGKFEPVFPDAPFIKEFVLRPTVKKVEKLQEAMAEAGFFAGLPTPEGYMSFCATEKRTKEEIDALVSAVNNAKGR